MSAALQRMDVLPRALGDHAPAAGAETVERLRAAAAPLAGRRVLHISAAGGGGGVPDLLGALLPLASDAGLTVEWRVLFGGPELSDVAAELRDGLQGAESAISDAAWKAYLDACASAAEPLRGEFDAIVLHDPAPLGLAAALADEKLVWRCHVDASRPDAPAWERASHLAALATRLVVSDPAFAPPGTEAPAVSAPGIDPLSARNLELAPRLAGRVLRGLGLDLDRPLVTQLMRLDRWKDPHATLDAFERLAGELPGLQLVLGCELDGADATGWAAAKEIGDYAAELDDVHLVTSYSGLGNLEIGALNQISRVALRMALREGFGLAAAEALWRGTPVVASGEARHPLVREGIDGHVARDAAHAAERVAELVGDPGLAIEMGRAGRERVRERFLVTRVLEDELRLLAGLG